jgi:diguanylate cyclase (GGDEF)-like protein
MSLSSHLLIVQRPAQPLEVLSARLAAWGWRMVACTSGEEMVDLLTKSTFDIIIVDVGVEQYMAIIGYLKANAATKRIPLVTVATQDPATVAAHALALGADDVINLPVEDAELYARIRALSRIRLMELERARREAVLREFGIPVERTAPAVPAFDKIGILLIGPAGQEQVQVVTALGGAAAIAYAETAASAFERLRRQDLEVAVITGADDPDEVRALCGVIRADGELYHLPVMLIARPDVFPDRAAPFEWGISDVLFHPFHPEVLRLRIHGWVRQQRLRRRLRGQVAGNALPPVVDRLTGLYGHGFLHRYVEHEIKHARAVGTPLTVAAFAVAGMSRINQEHGFVLGDGLLAELAAMIARLSRAEDLTARYDADRFAVVLGGMSASEAQSVTERIVQAVAETGFEAGSPRPLRAQLRPGVALLESGDDAFRLIRRAFEQMDLQPLQQAS